MVPDDPQPPRDAGPHLLLYDGACGLCNRIVQAVLARDRSGMFHFASLQSPAATRFASRFGAEPDMSTFVVVSNYRTPQSAWLTKGRAAVFVLTAFGGPWKLAALLGLLPSPLLDRIYDVIARNRHRLFPPVERCLVPPPEYRSRFLDAVDADRKDVSR